ncbi:MAG: cytochrome c-type biogenesis protein CcmH [Magnetococcales bacterium]|nr:cytochrome c-type biogenesis protein CcmH [Magnetococcales bacterium]
MKTGNPWIFLTGWLLAWFLTTLPGVASEKMEEPSEAMVRTIAKSLRCAVCQNQSVYESNSDLAKDMLGVIRSKVVAGESEYAIRDYFFQRYGDYIYLEPTTQGSNRLLWIGPFVALLVGALALLAALKKWRRPSSPIAPVTPADHSFKERLQRELKQIES